MKVNDIYLQLAEYHVWANNLLLKSLEPVSDEDYKIDRGMFFKSIHATLNHILLADSIWYSRFTGTEFRFTSLSQELYPDRKELAEQLIQQASRWKNFIAETDDTRFGELLEYNDSKGTPQKTNFALTLNHVFNHATHHRGQISTAISQLGYKAPEMDLPYFLRGL